MIDRRVKVESISGSITGIKEGDTAPFSTLLHARNIILLGDPGAGKTELFKYVQRVYGGKYEKAARFIIGSPVTSDRNYYIDALDERRSPTDKMALTDQITEKLWDVRPEFFRLSSRKQDWLGDADLEIFRSYFDENGGYIVVTLLPLSDAELISILTSKEIESPIKFIEEAKARKLEGLLHNPQNAIMLAQAVSSGSSWPSTRRDVFNAAVDALLSEHNSIKAGRDGIHYSADELRNTAGELCALRLIADLPGFRLHGEGKNGEGLFYRRVRSDRQELIRAVLQRPAFRATDDDDCLDCIHRTVAEFMAGQWLATRVDSDLSPARLDALVGREGNPVIALRGLWAWMPVFSRVHSARYLRADPLGVLTNGDVHSLTTECKRVLLYSLRDYSRFTPWFSTWGEAAEGLKALGIPELLDDILALLEDASTSDNMRLALLRMITSDLVKSTSLSNVCRQLVEAAELNYAQAEEALTALFLDWNANRQWVKLMISEQDLTDERIRLRACALSLVPADEFEPAEMTRLLQDILVYPVHLPAGTLYSFHKDLCPAHALSVIKAMAGNLPDPHSHWMNANEVGYLINIKVYELFRDDAFSEEEDINACLDLLNFFSKTTVLYDTEKNHLKEVISPYKRRILSLARNELFSRSEMISEFSVWAHKIVVNSLTVVRFKDVLHLLIDGINEPCISQPIKSKIYSASLSICLHQCDDCIGEFEYLMDISITDIQYSKTRDFYSVCTLSDNFFQFAGQKRKIKNQKEDFILRLNEDFDRILSSDNCVQKNKILIKASAIYWGENVYVREMDYPNERMAALITSRNIDTLKEVWKQLLLNYVMHDFDELIRVVIMSHRSPDGLSLLTAAEIYFQEKKNLSELGDEVLCVLLVLELTQQIMYSVRNGMELKSYRFPWLEWLKTHRSAFIGETLIRFLASVERLSPTYHYKKMIVRRLLAPEYSGLWLKMLSILRHDLDNSLDIICASLTHSVNLDSIASLSVKIREEYLSLPEKITDMWDAFDFLVSETASGEVFINKLSLKPDAYIMIRDLAGLGQYGEKQNIAISPEKTEKIISSMIPLFPEREEIRYGVVTAGSTAGQDGERFICRLITILAADGSAVASSCLARLAEMHAVSSYRDDIMQARQSQIQRRRELEYVSPSWSEVKATLMNQKPANVADLHALLCERLQYVAKEIRHGNTDSWKFFWNEGSYGAVDTPRSENSGTDTLITLLTPHLKALDVRLEPELHMARDKRADIGATFSDHLKIPIEVKRHYHSEVWSAAENQLQKLYAPDPQSDGYGILLVFWFGEKCKTPMPLHPLKRIRPSTAFEMELWLNDIIAPEARTRIKCFVLDVSETNT